MIRISMLFWYSQTQANVIQIDPVKVSFDHFKFVTSIVLVLLINTQKGSEELNKIVKELTLQEPPDGTHTYCFCY